MFLRYCRRSRHYRGAVSRKFCHEPEPVLFGMGQRSVRKGAHAGKSYFFAKLHLSESRSNRRRYKKRHGLDAQFRNISYYKCRLFCRLFGRLDSCAYHGCGIHVRARGEIRLWRNHSSRRCRQSHHGYVLPYHGQRNRSPRTLQSSDVGIQDRRFKAQKQRLRQRYEFLVDRVRRHGRLHTRHRQVPR